MGVHDRAFKQLISTFLLEFLDLFFPQVREYLDESSLVFLDKEIFTDLLTGQQREADLVARAQWRGRETFFLISIEGQGDDTKGFQERFYLYCHYLYQKYRAPVYPIVVFYGDYPAAQQPHTFRVGFADLTVFEFKYRVLQLNKLNWRDFVRQPNPVASALMARMKIAPRDRPYVKLECLRLLVSLKLDRARMHFISAFVDHYLTLNDEDEAVFKQELAKIEPERKEVMELTTSWMREGIQIGEAQGKAQGKRDEALSLATRLLQRRFKAAFVLHERQLENLSLTQLEDLIEAMFDFKDTSDLAQWMARQN